MNKEQLISEVLLLPTTAIDYHVGQHLLQLFPGKALIEWDGQLNIEGYAEAQHCTFVRHTFTYNQMNTYWRGRQPQVLRPHHVMHMGPGMVPGMELFQDTGEHSSKPETQDMIDKNLFLSSKMRWIAHPQQGTMEQVMSEQVGKLREQMLSVNTAVIPEEDAQAVNPMFGPMMARNIRFQHRMQG
jgi:hypothetical protein